MDYLLLSKQLSVKFFKLIFLLIVVFYALFALHYLIGPVIKL